MWQGTAANRLALLSFTYKQTGFGKRVAYSPCVVCDAKGVPEDTTNEKSAVLTEGGENNQGESREL